MSSYKLINMILNPPKQGNTGVVICRLSGHYSILIQSDPKY